jgi:hypothetical protein
MHSDPAISGPAVSEVLLGDLEIGRAVCRWTSRLRGSIRRGPIPTDPGLTNP